LADGSTYSEPLVPPPNPFEVEIAIGKLQRYKSLGMNQYPAEYIQAGGETLRSETRKLCNNDLPRQGKGSVIVSIYK
jgi:hypothetical protein